MQPLDDIRVEVMVANWLENQRATMDSILIKPVGTFLRPYNRDVITVEPAEASHKDKVVVQISREGIYDMLPEGLFHEARQKRHRSTGEAIEETRRYAREERDARHFFLPLEQEFYRQRFWIESTELKFWLHSRQPDNIKLLMRFWQLDPADFTQEQSTILVSLLPQLHHIVGDMPLTAQCLEAILHEKVRITTTQDKQVEIDGSLLSVLGEAVLGEDATLGTSWLNDDTSVLVEIGPIKRNNLSGFLYGGHNDNALQILYSYLFQAELEVETTVQVLPEEADFILSHADTVSHLGYSTVL